MSDLQVDPYPLPEGAFRGARARAIRLNAARRRNALTAATVEHLERVLDEDPEELLLLASSTPGIFCAGADLATNDATRAALSDRLYACYALMVTRPGPVVAVVEGAAVGGGAQLCAAADLRVASPAARWRWAGPGHGLAVGGWVLPELVGRSRALDLTLTGRWLGAEEAATAGFARLADDPWEAARAMVADLVAADPAALSRLKQVTARGPLLERLHEERAANSAAWSGSAPSIRIAAEEGRRRGG